MYYVLTMRCIYEIGDRKIEVPTYSIRRNSKVPNVSKAKFIFGQIGGCPNTEACNDLDTGDCPIEAGEEFIYNMQMKIESYFPPGPVDGEWNLEAPNEKKFVSFIVPIRIQ